MLAIIGGSGLLTLDFLEADSTTLIQTVFQNAPVQVTRGTYKNNKLLFLPRHGEAHSIPPHLVNYRANISALKHAGAQQIIAVNAVGGIETRLKPGAIAIPDQLIDYSHSRQGTFFDGVSTAISHVDFTYPYDAGLRESLIASAEAINEGLAEPISIVAEGVYACMQGPRLETKAEVIRLQRDGCTMVGMTGMPEAVLARELNLQYACIALSVNWAAGISKDLISMEQINAVLQPGIQFITKVLEKVAGITHAEPQ